MGKENKEVKKPIKKKPREKKDKPVVKDGIIYIKTKYGIVAVKE